MPSAAIIQLSMSFNSWFSLIVRAPVKQVWPLITLTDASGQQSTMDTNTRDKFVVTPQILSYYSELKMWTVDKKKNLVPCVVLQRDISGKN